MHSDTGFLSSSLIRRVIVICGALAALLTALNFGMKWYGDRIIQAGHTTSTDEVEITIGNDRLNWQKTPFGIRLIVTVVHMSAPTSTSPGPTLRGIEIRIVPFSTIRKMQSG